MYLSRLILNPRDRRVRRDLADCHALHRTVMSGFPNLAGVGVSAAAGDARAQLGVLYRLEPQTRADRIDLLVQSAMEPNWSLDDGYLLDLAGEPPNPDTKPIDRLFDALRPGLVLTFRLRANPTKRLMQRGGSEDKTGGKRVDLRTEEDQLAWLARKGEQGGFAILTVRTMPTDEERRRQAVIFGRPEHAFEPAGDVPDVRTLPGDRVIGRRGGGASVATNGSPRSAMRMTFGSVLFEGMLQVVDLARFRAALSEGIGSGKAYGFGLLSIAPAARSDLTGGWR